MTPYQSLFARQEIKFLVQQWQYDRLIDCLQGALQADACGEVTIGNIYYDTPDFQLIRASLEKPKYKEKLRLRCYNQPSSNSNTFVEIKKKYRGTVYKRRIAMPYQEAFLELEKKKVLSPDDSFEHRQISAEISYMMDHYPDLQPAMCVFYDRLAWQGIRQPDLRITFDRNLRWRTQDLDLRMGSYGMPILEPGQRIMEIKVQQAIPLWLCHALSELEVYKTSFSKYGRGYMDYRRCMEHVTNIA